MSKSSQWFHIPINPDPWAIGPLSVGKRNGKYFPIVGRNAQLDAFKHAVAEELESQGVTPVDYDEYALRFFFWRRLDSHEKGRKHHADATNLQKATEDALQGVLIGNDRNVRLVHSEIVAQGPDVNPGILIHIEDYRTTPYLSPDIPEAMWDKATRVTQQATLFDNTWPPA